MEWQSVKDGYPSDLGWVVVSGYTCGDPDDRREPIVARYKEGHWYDTNDDDVEYQCDVEITHWIKLPKI